TRSPLSKENVVPAEMKNFFARFVYPTIGELLEQECRYPQIQDRYNYLTRKVAALHGQLYQLETSSIVPTDPNSGEEIQASFGHICPDGVPKVIVYVPVLQEA